MPPLPATLPLHTIILHWIEDLVILREVAAVKARVAGHGEIQKRVALATASCNPYVEFARLMLEVARKCSVVRMLLIVDFPALMQECAKWMNSWERWKRHAVIVKKNCSKIGTGNKGREEGKTKRRARFAVAYKQKVR